jgi:hypothetical protein
MSGILFLIEVSAFVLLAYWAFRNDKIGLTEGGTGLFAMLDPSAPAEPKSRTPKWKQGLKTPAAAQKQAVAGLLASGQKPQWAQKLPAIPRRF